MPVPPVDSRTLWWGPEGRAAAAILAYVLLYVALDRLSDVRPVLTLGITPWNPQAGLTLAFLLIYGPRWAPATALATFIAEYWIDATPVAPWAMGLASLWVGASYGALASVLRRSPLPSSIDTAIGAARFAGIAAVGTLVIALGYVGLFVILGDLPPTDALRGIARYWVGELDGVLTLTSLLLLAPNWKEHMHGLRGRYAETLTQFVAVALTLCVIFLLPAADQLRFFYLLFVPVIWIALRWSWPGAMLAVFVIEIGLLVAATTHIPTPRFIDLQFLMLTLSLTGLLLGAVVAERAGVLARVAMREAEQRALLAMAPDAVLAVDGSNRIRMANSAALRLFGAQAGEQQAPQLTVFLPGLRLEAAEGRVTLDGRREDGSVFPAEIAWARLDTPAHRRFLVTVRDATERQRAEERLRERDAALARAMRFAVAGELASALAHELNQPITALVSYLQASEILAARASGDDERLGPTLSKAAREAIRASEVLRRLRDFYRGGAFKREPIHVPAVCNAVVAAFHDRLRRADASLLVAVDPSIREIPGDSMQLEIVLHNLLANALDSVSQLPSSSRRIELHGTQDDDAVTLRVEDSGSGVAPGIAPKLFEPFVTSKSDGMGLGLAISGSLIRARGGELSFAPSKKLGGAAFTIRLPFEIPPETSPL